MESMELVTNNDQLVLAVEVDPMIGMLYSLMGYNPHDLPYEMSVWTRASDPVSLEEALNMSLEEAAPLHQEFFSTWYEARVAAETAKKHIDAGTFNYNPPLMPF